MLPTGDFRASTHPARQRDWSMRSRSGSGNAGRRMTAMCIGSADLEMPALGVGYEEVDETPGCARPI